MRIATQGRHFLANQKESCFFCMEWNLRNVTISIEISTPEGAASSMRIEEAEKQEYEKMNECPW